MRADYRCVSAAENERYVWEQQLEGTPFAQHLSSSRVEVGAARARGRGPGRPQLRADDARHVAARLADDAPRPGRDPRRGAGRDRGGADARDDSTAEAARATRSGGGGGTRRSRRSSTPRRWRCCASGSASWSRGRWRASWSELRAARRREPLPPALVDAVGAEAVFTADEDRLRHASGSGYADLARLRARPPRGGPRRGRGARPTPPPLRRVLDACAAEGVAVVPFGGGTSVVGGVEPLRGAHERLISLDLGRPARGRGRPPLADRPPRRRPARARGGGGARRPGPHPRPLPAVLRVRDDRRLRRDPLRRPGLERLRALRRAGQLGAPARAGRRSCGRWRPRTPPPGRRCASWSSAPRACSA